MMYITNIAYLILFLSTFLDFCTTEQVTPLLLQDSPDVRVVSVRKGENAILSCEVLPNNNEQPLPYVIEWFRDEIPVFIKVGKHPPHINNEFEDRLSIDGDVRSNASLQIENVTLSDEGWYQCQVLFLKDRFEKSSNGTWVKLEVRDPPSFREIPPLSKISRLGDSLLLKCRANGRPQPVITWRKDGRLVRDGQDGILLSGGDLAVTSLTTSHRGKYTCRAQSIEGLIQSSTTVQVEAPPEFKKTPSDLTTEEGQDATFDCSATGYPSTMKYSWTYNDKPVSSKSLRVRSSVLPDGSLTIYNIKSTDRGNVTCTVENGFGVSPTASASLFVQFPARVSNMPAIAYAGLTLKAILKCPSEAEPPVNKIIWKKDDRRISPHQNPRISLEGDGSLVIESASIRDAGRYTCIPYNIRGTLGESTGTMLRIRDPPFFTKTPKPVYEAEIGKTLNIPCKGGGDPPPAVTWRKVLQSGDSVHYKVEFGNLTIRSVTKSIHGTWQCVLTNSVAEQTKNVEIYVKYTSPHKVTNVTAKALNDSAIRVTWIPGYNGGHPQRFMIWYKRADKIDPSWQTFHVDGIKHVGILDNLQSNTLYELAVLPENKIKSGPFSETVTIRTKASRLPLNTQAPLLLPPQGLIAGTTDEGFVKLSWRKPGMFRQVSNRRLLGENPTSSNNLDIRGFLVEFQWTGIAEKNLEESESNQRRDTDKLKSREKRSSSTMPRKNHWETLTMANENTSSMVIGEDQLYRDIMYEFRVLTVSENEYSPPSNPVTLSTKDPVIAGVLAAIILVILFVVIVIICICRRRRKRKKMKAAMAASGEDAAQNTSFANHISPKMNGQAVSGQQPVVVDLTSAGSGGYGTIERREFKLQSSNDKLQFNNKINESEEKLRNFIESHNNRTDIERKETSSSDRSSVRLRRETSARVLLAQYKRRSFTDHTYHRAVHRKDLPLRGGTRSASTSPERNNNFGGIGDLNVTAPAEFDLPSPTGRKRIRLYSRPIDDENSSQQRRMIIIKRKSQKSSSTENTKGASYGALPSDSSESPVFGVIGTIKHHSTDSIIQSGPKASSPIRQFHRRPSNSNRHAIEDDVFCRFNVTDNKDDDVIIRGRSDDRAAWKSPMSDPTPELSSKDTSPDVSPNRVKERRNVKYDPLTDPSLSPISPSPPQIGDRWIHGRQKSKSLTHEQCRILHSHRSGRYDEPYSGAQYIPPHYVTYDVASQLQPPNHINYPHGFRRTRYSLAHHPTTHRPGQYHHGPPVQNVSRTRASYSYAHQPLSLFSPNQDFDPTSRQAHPTVIQSHSMPQPTNEPPQSTCEIDCSNSDIEVRFIKDPNGDAYIPVLPEEVDVVNPTLLVHSPSSATSANATSTMTPSSGNSVLDLRYNLRSQSTSSKGNHDRNRITSPINAITPRPRHLLSPMSFTSSPTRHVKLKSSDATDHPTSPPLAVGSSDYGSQDTSNSSTSPMTLGTHIPTSPLHLRFPGIAQDRPPRRDNSSVEDNYEWDSEIAMESEILEALRHFGTLKKSGPVSDELLDELKKITKETKNAPIRQRAQSADILESHSPHDGDMNEENDEALQPNSPGLTYSKESMARRCAALRAEFLHYQQLQQLDEDDMT